MALTTAADVLGVDLSVSAAAYPTATLHEAAGRVGDLPRTIKPVHPSFRVSGPALPVSCPPGSNLHIHHALLAASPGDVLVVDVQGGTEWGYWGEILSEAAKARGLAGLVINGCVRDQAEILDAGFPIFATGISIRGTVKVPSGGTVGEAVQLGHTRVGRGDIVIGDLDGVVVLKRPDSARIIEEAKTRTAKELDIITAIRRGGSTVDLYGFEPLTD
jgi:4-hydroxy-4-methyl-2-oxoglutarate aldolase